MKPIALLLLLAILPVMAVDLPETITIDGTEYKAVRYTSHDAQKVKFAHADGMASVEIPKLPEPIQQSLGYDPAAAKQAAADRAAAHNAALQAVQARQQAAAALRREGSETTSARRNEQAIATLKTTIAKKKAELRAVEEAYAKAMAGVDTSARVYTFSDGQQLRSENDVSNHPRYRTPENTARRKLIADLKEWIAQAESELASLR